MCVYVHGYLHASEYVHNTHSGVYLLHRVISCDLLIKHLNVTLQTLKIVQLDLIYICIYIGPLAGYIR